LKSISNYQFSIYVLHKQEKYYILKCMDPDENVIGNQGPQMAAPVAPTTEGGFAGGGIQEATPNTAQPPTPIQEPAAPQQPPTQQISPLDPPPPPMAGTTPGVGGDLKEVITPSKPRGKFPLLAILIILIVLVLGGVGFLAYQNMQLKNKTASPAGNTISAPVTPFATPTPNPYLNFKTVQGESIPVEVMIPSNWTVEQTENAELGNQKMIDAKSLDFAYEGASVSAGYEFRIGPVSDLTKKYNSFEEFSAEANKDASYDVVVYNQIKFLKKDTTAQTLIDKTPVSIALYTAPVNETDSIILFNQILATFKILGTPSVTETPASPSAIPSM
jgi:flagellar basal body-associated protein FliL